ncbi:MAG: hypothetical protein ACRDRQ_16895 [Pseudonocardiaceae bacterium]
MGKYQVTYQSGGGNTNATVTTETLLELHEAGQLLVVHAPVDGPPLPEMAAVTAGQ